MNRRGVSLIELLVVLVIGGVISGVIVGTLMGQMQITSTQNRTIINQQSIREVLEYMTEEITVAGAGVAEPYISTGETEDFRFVADIDGDGDWDRVRYWRTGTNLLRELATSSDQGVNWTVVSSDIMLQGISTLQFTYLAHGNVAPVDLSEITSVEIRVTQDASHGTTRQTVGKVAQGRMVSRATIRNRLLSN